MAPVRTTSDPALAEGLSQRRFAAVLFDLDGTLVDSTASVVRCWRRWAEEHDITLERLQAAAGHGRPARDIVADLVEPEAVRAATYRIAQLEVADVAGITLLPGAQDAVERTAGASAFVTSCTYDLAVARIGAAGLVQRGDPRPLVTVDDVVHGKPDPEPFLLGARRLGVDPDRCLVVEDAPSGLLAARAAGMATVAVITTHTAAELAGLADVIVGDLGSVSFERQADGTVTMSVG